MLFTLSLMRGALYYSDLSLSGEKESVCALYGRVISISSSKESGKNAISLSLKCTEDKSGSLFSSKGILTVYMPRADYSFSDTIKVTGSFSDELFIGRSSELIRRGPLSRLRRMLSDLIKTRTGYSSLGSLLLLGRSDMPSSLSDIARRGGLSHVIALSGMHLAFISLFLMPFRILFRGRKYPLFRFMVLFVFVYLSGWKCSLFRSFIFMVLISVFDMSLSYFLSFAVLLIINPYASLDLGFTLSFLSLGSILAFSDLISGSLKRLIPINSLFLKSIGASISALLVTIPVVLLEFGSYRLLPIITSLFSSLIVEVALFLGLLSLFFPSIGIRMIKRYEAFFIRAMELFSIGDPIDAIYPYILLVISSSLLMLFELFMRKGDKRGRGVII